MVNEQIRSHEHSEYYVARVEQLDSTGWKGETDATEFRPWTGHGRRDHDESFTHLLTWLGPWFRGPLLNITWEIGRDIIVLRAKSRAAWTAVSVLPSMPVTVPVTCTDKTTTLGMRAAEWPCPFYPRNTQGVVQPVRWRFGIDER